MSELIFQNLVYKATVYRTGAYRPNTYCGKHLSDEVKAVVEKCKNGYASFPERKETMSLIEITKVIK